MEKVGIEPTTCRASIDRYYLLSYFSEESRRPESNRLR